jgi:hypothetical protein
MHPPSTRYRPCQATSRSAIWSTLQSCGGASNAIIRNSSRRSGLAIAKAADGEDSIIMPLSASRPMDSWSPRGRRFPPHDLVPPLCYRCLPYPTVTDPEDPPLRPERHIPNSIATMADGSSTLSWANCHVAHAAAETPAGQFSHSVFHTVVYRYFKVDAGGTVSFLISLRIFCASPIAAC